MVFHWSLSDSKSPQVSWTLLSILAIFNNAVVWIISIRPPTSKSSRPFNNPLVTVPKALITIGTIVTFLFQSFFNSLARSRYLSFFSHSFCFILWSNLNFLYISQWTTLPTQSCLALYSFYANLLHSLIIWLIVSSLSPHSLHLLFSCVLSILALICPGFPVWNIIYQSFKAAIELFFPIFVS